jgi:hypothetical protein
LLIKEAALIPAEPLLNNRQKRYALRILQLPSTNPINGLLPPILRYGNGDAQLRKYSNNNLQWTEPNSNPKGLRQRLAKNFTLNLNIDFFEGFERAIQSKESSFPENITIEQEDVAEKNARKIYNIDSNLIL